MQCIKCNETIETHPFVLIENEEIVGQIHMKCGYTPIFKTEEGDILKQGETVIVNKKHDAFSRVIIKAVVDYTTGAQLIQIPHDCQERCINTLLAKGHNTINHSQLYKDKEHTKVKRSYN